MRLADHLCAPGWDVCNWDTHAHILRKVTWDTALSIDGCFAYNAAQDGGRCRECRNHLERVSESNMMKWAFIRVKVRIKDYKNVSHVQGFQEKMKPIFNSLLL